MLATLSFLKLIRIEDVIHGEVQANAKELHRGAKASAKELYRGAEAARRASDLDILSGAKQQQKNLDSEARKELCQKRKPSKAHANSRRYDTTEWLPWSLEHEAPLPDSAALGVLTLKTRLRSRDMIHVNSPLQLHLYIYMHIDSFLRT